MSTFTSYCWTIKELWNRAGRAQDGYTWKSPLFQLNGISGAHFQLEFGIKDESCEPSNFRLVCVRLDGHSSVRLRFKVRMEHDGQNLLDEGMPLNSSRGIFSRLQTKRTSRTIPRWTKRANGPSGSSRRARRTSG
jgi:hypothetical protein